MKYSLRFLDNGDSWGTYAEWTEERGLVIKTALDELNTFSDRIVDHTNMVYKVGVVCDPPFVICGQQRSGLLLNNDELSGFAMALLRKIQESLGFGYEVYKRFMQC